MIGRTTRLTEMTMRETMELGPVPCEENCQQVGTPSYNPVAALAECRAYMAQLERQFGSPPDGATLVIRRNRHDFGTYYEVAVSYDDEDAQASEYAYNIEGCLPEKWDDEAKKTLGLV